MKKLLKHINSGVIIGAAPVSNSGLRKSIEKILPTGFAAEINTTSWTIPTVFGWLQANVNGLTPQTILDKFNCGIGLVMVVPKTFPEINEMQGAYVIGKCYTFKSCEKSILLAFITIYRWLKGYFTNTLN